MSQVEERDVQTKNDMIAVLDGLRKDHPKVARYILNATDGEFYPLDILVFAVLNRSASLIKGVTLLVGHNNLICATPLLRLQLDNLLRLHAAQLVGDPHAFATEVIKGTRVADIKDRTNRRMTDRYLVNKLSEDDPRIQKVYEHTSGYVHLSNQHINAALRLKGNDGRFEMKLDGTDSFDSEYPYLEMMAAFTEITNRLLCLVNSWGEAKAQIRSQRGMV